MKSGAHLSQVPARTDWATPWPLFRELDAEFHFTLDVCATPENAKCEKFFAPTDDGLARDWGENVCWMNPPFGRDIPKWMSKAFAATWTGATVVCLVPSRTCTKWWHDYAERADEQRFIKGRVRFEGAQHNAPFPCVILVFRANPYWGKDSKATRLTKAAAA